MALIKSERAPHWRSYGMFNLNIATMTNDTDANQGAYLTVCKSCFPQGVFSWIRHIRYGLSTTAGTPNWDTNATRYWANMYARPDSADVMTGRKIILDPILWVRQGAGANMVNPCAMPTPFGRDSAGAPIPDAQNTWRRDIRLNMDRLAWSDVGTTGGESFVANARFTNFNVLGLLGPNEIDAWTNARMYYLADGEVGGNPAYAVATRAEAGPLAGTAGLNTLLLRMYDHQRHIFDWAREKRPDIGCYPPSLIQNCLDKGKREFAIYEFLKFSHAGAGLPVGCMNDVADAIQIHNHMRQHCIPDPWSGAVPGSGQISPYHYWKAQQETQNIRALSGLPDNTRPLVEFECGQDYISSGASTAGRTDLHQLRNFRYGILVLGELYYSACAINFYSLGKSSATGFNVINPADNKPWTTAAGERDADFIYAAMDDRESCDVIPIIAKTWQEYWRPQTWAVWIDQQQDPIDGGPDVCPFVEWKRVTFADNLLTMAPGARNLVARKKNLGVGEHVFRAQVKLSESAAAAARIFVSGHDKLNGLKTEASNVLQGVNDWTTLEVRFTPRQHHNPRVPDPKVGVLLIDHNGLGTCQVRNPEIVVP